MSLCRDQGRGTRDGFVRSRFIGSLEAVGDSKTRIISVQFVHGWGEGMKPPQNQSPTVRGGEGGGMVHD